MIITIEQLDVAALRLAETRDGDDDSVVISRSNADYWIAIVKLASMMVRQKGGSVQL